MAEVGGEVVAALALEPAPVSAGTCNWPVVYADCAGGCVEVWERWPEPDREAAKAWFESQAIDLLWNWTNRVFGVCAVTVRPCRDDCGGGGADPQSTFWGRGPGFDRGFPRAGGSGWMPALIGGAWLNVGCGCVGTCNCRTDGAHALSLPGPIVSVQSVEIDGQVIPSTSYRIDYGRLLVRTDGEAWPACQNMNAEPGQPGTFVVEYSRGVVTPTGGQVAAGKLACELALAACNDDDCALPERLQTITRQGITVGVSLTGEDWRDTGIWSIDSWVQSVTQARSYASVRSVDVRPRFRGR